MLEFYLLVAPCVPGAAFKNVEQYDHIPNLSRYAVGLAMYLPVLSSPEKSCFGIDVYLDSYKELGSNLGKLSEAFKNLIKVWRGNSNKGCLYVFEHEAQTYVL